MRKILRLFVALLVASPLFAQTDRGATLPQAFVANATLTTPAVFPNTAGYIVKTVCASGCDYTSIQTASNNVHTDTGDVNGETILLKQGASFTENVTFPAYTMTAGKWVIIETNPSPGALPAANVRQDPSFSGTLAVWNANTANVRAFTTAANTNFVWLANIEFVLTASGTTDAVLGCGNGETTDGTMPSNIIFDRLYVHDNAGNTKNMSHGITGNCNASGVINSYILEQVAGSQGNGLIVYNSKGPWMIDNSYIVGSQSFMFGAADPSVSGTTATIAADNATCANAGLCQTSSTVATVTCTANCGAAFANGATVYIASNTVANSSLFVGEFVIQSTPTSTTFTINLNGAAGTHAGGGSTNVGGYVVSDILIRGSDFTAPLTWWPIALAYGGTHFSRTNAGEVKNGQRVLIQGCVFENSWGDQQDGFGLLLNSVDAFGGCIQCIASNIVVRYSVFRHSSDGIQLCPAQCSSGSLSSGQTNIAIHDNLFYDINPQVFNPGNGLGIIQYTNRTAGNQPTLNVVIDHNTMLGSKWGTNNSLAPRCVLCMSNTMTNPASGWVFTNNLTSNGNFGIFGGGSSMGNSSISSYLGTATVTNNVFIDVAYSGGAASNYSNYTPNWFPANTSVMNFVDLKHGNFTLAGGDTVCGGATCTTAGTDGLPIGANIALIMSSLTPTEAATVFANSVSGGANYANGVIQ